MTTKHYIGSKTVKYLGEGGMKTLKRVGGGWGRSVSPGGWGLRRDIQLVKKAGKTNIMMRTAE